MAWPIARPVGHCSRRPVSPSSLITSITSSMKFSRSALTASLALMSHGVSAFRPMTTRRAFVATTRLSAQVSKLQDPQSELLDKTDVFIFDCDGVIWRVSTTSSRYGDFVFEDLCVRFVERDRGVRVDKRNETKTVLAKKAKATSDETSLQSLSK